MPKTTKTLEILSLQLLLNCLEKQGVPTLRYSAQQLVDRGRVVDGRYYVDDKEVAVIYFRSMYDPAHFKSRDFWTARRDMEFSAAVTVRNRETVAFFCCHF